MEVACLNRVMGKPELDDCVLYDELELLLENYGVQKDQQNQADELHISPIAKLSETTIER